MKKCFSILVFFLIGLSATAQFAATIQWHAPKSSTVGDTIYYNPDYKLIWSDFRGRPDAASPAAAITESGFGYKMTMNSSGNKTNVVITVFCYFNKKKSWVKKGMDSDYALLHEQHHYDITYINAYQFVQKLREAPLNKGNFNYLVNKIHDECFAAMGSMQDDYDGQTSNGRIKAIQAAWNKKLDFHLASLTTD